MWMQECGTCASAKSGGLQVWMRHLTEEHVLPSEWPSDRAVRLTGPAALKPYTTITESKKKRRKDSIPRPLNSFMLFAQHIRRNVLRVFSDASNSVISQQLGDLWRTVPLRLRNQYDEEANRLVKIHQLEFPNYKYQPKKRVPLNSQTNGMTSFSCSTVSPSLVNGTNTTVSTSTTGQIPTDSSRIGSTREVDCAARMLNRIHNRDVELSGNVLTIRPRLNGTGPSLSTGLSHPVESTVRVISPQKGSVKTVYTRLEPKRQNSVNGSLGSSSGLHKSSSHSLSSVLPPLLTPTLSCPVTSTGRSGSCSADPFQIGSCDSAYASGINSSSSSSASSPAVGDLLSPAKSLASVPTSGARSSPSRRKIQLIPIRPQSQQQQQQQPAQHMSQINELPTRQRFFSAHNGSMSPFSVASPLTESPTTPDLVCFMPSSCGSSSASSTSSAGFRSATSFDALDEVDSAVQPVLMAQIQQQQRQHHHHQQQQQQQSQAQVFTPVYVKLDTDGSRPNEELILALPPGTTVIQAVGNMGQLQSIPVQQACGAFGRKVYVTNGGRSGSTTSYPVGRSGASMQLLHPVRFMNVLGRTVRSQDSVQSVGHTVLDELSPATAYSPGSSVFSPLSNDVFLPLHHRSTNLPAMKSELDDEHATNNQDSTIYIQKREDTCQPIYQSTNGHQFDMEVDQTNAVENVGSRGYIKMEEEEEELYLARDSVFEATMLDGSVVPWPIAASNTDQNRTVMSNAGITFTVANSIAVTSPLPPLTVDVLKFSPSSCASCPPTSTTPCIATTHGTLIDATAGQTPTSEFPMSTEDEQFDTSFDAMMNSIDITTFLPGTFSASDDQFLEPEFNSNPSAVSGSANSPSLPGLDPINEDSCIFQPIPDYSGKVEFIPERCGLDPCTNSHSSSSPSSSSLVSSSSAHPVYAISPLADLDALDKSSLFMIKPEWPVTV